MSFFLKMMVFFLSKFLEVRLWFCIGFILKVDCGFFKVFQEVEVVVDGVFLVIWSCLEKEEMLLGDIQIFCILRLQGGLFFDIRVIR